MSANVRVVAKYFPQLHAIPENDEWWGRGFTDWANVQRAKPLFPGHYQPRVPLGSNYYDQSKADVIRGQARLARAHGVDAFCMYHYWFDGKQLLQKPPDQLLKHKDIDIQFCLCWANETWSRRWDGHDHHILIAQTHPPTVESWGRHFDRLIKYWLDERAMRIDGKPVFLIYRALKIPHIGWLFDYWQTRAKREYGLPGIYFVNVVQHDYPPWEILRHFDAATLFQPFHAVHRGGIPLRQVPRPPLNWAANRAANVLRGKARELAKRVLEMPHVVDYDAVWREILSFRASRHMPVFQGAYVDWDNTGRYQNRATIYQHATPEKFGRYMQALLEKVAAGPASDRYVFVNAWNEWAESAYLEPDERHGTAYLEALRDARSRASRAASESRTWGGLPPPSREAPDFVSSSASRSSDPRSKRP